MVQEMNSLSMQGHPDKLQHKCNRKRYFQVADTVGFPGGEENYFFAFGVSDINIFLGQQNIDSCVGDIRCDTVCNCDHRFG